MILDPHIKALAIDVLETAMEYRAIGDHHTMCVLAQLATDLFADANGTVLL